MQKYNILMIVMGILMVISGLITTRRLYPYSLALFVIGGLLVFLGLFKNKIFSSENKEEVKGGLQKYDKTSNSQNRGEKESESEVNFIE